MCAQVRPTQPLAKAELHHHWQLQLPVVTHTHTHNPTHSPQPPPTRYTTPLLGTHAHASDAHAQHAHASHAHASAVSISSPTITPCTTSVKQHDGVMGYLPVKQQPKAHVVWMKNLHGPPPAPPQPMANKKNGDSLGNPVGDLQKFF
jgi:hypothetical protein